MHILTRLLFHAVEDEHSYQHLQVIVQLNIVSSNEKY